MEIKKDLKYTLCTSDDNIENNINIVDQAINETQIQEINSSDVDKKKQIELDDTDTLFQFDCDVDDDNLILKLSEIDALAPFIYIKKITLDELIKVHKVFRACDNLNEVKGHIDKLFESNRIKLSQKKREEIIFNFKIFYLSYEDKFQIIAKREMTDNKDPMLLKLYDIQKKKLKILKEFEKYIKTLDGKGNAKEIEKKLKEIKESIEK